MRRRRSPSASPLKMRRKSYIERDCTIHAVLRVRSVLLAVLASLAMSCATAHSFKLNDLSTDEKIGQLFVPDAYGVYMSSSSFAYQRLERFVKERHVGGFVWFLSNVYENALLTNRLQAISRVPL